jgi:hypothetical protein
MGTGYTKLPIHVVITDVKLLSLFQRVLFVEGLKIWFVFKNE